MSSQIIDVLNNIVGIRTTILMGEAWKLEGEVRNMLDSINIYFSDTKTIDSNNANEAIFNYHTLMFLSACGSDIQRTGLLNVRDHNLIDTICDVLSDLQTHLRGENIQRAKKVYEKLVSLHERGRFISNPYTVIDSNFSEPADGFALFMILKEKLM